MKRLLLHVSCLHVFRLLRDDVDLPEQTVRFIIQARGEKERVAGAGGAVVAEVQGPEAVVVDGQAGVVVDVAEEFPGAWVEGGDASGAEHSDQQIARKIAKSE